MELEEEKQTMNLLNEINICLNQESINNKMLWFLHVYESIPLDICDNNLMRLRSKILNFRKRQDSMALLKLFDTISMGENAALLYNPEKQFSKTYNIDSYKITIDNESTNIFKFIIKIENEIFISLGKIKRLLSEEDNDLLS